MRINYSIVFVSDMERSVAFYRDVVGIPLKFETPGWTEFLTDAKTGTPRKRGPKTGTENGDNQVLRDRKRGQPSFNDDQTGYRNLNSNPNAKPATSKTEVTGFCFMNDARRAQKSENGDNQVLTMIKPDIAI